jgi:hypothetical protein
LNPFCRCYTLDYLPSTQILGSTRRPSYEHVDVLVRVEMVTKPQQRNARFVRHDEKDCKDTLAIYMHSSSECKDTLAIYMHSSSECRGAALRALRTIAISIIAIHCSQ